MISLVDIKKFLRGEIAVDEPMSKHNWMKVGGPADFFIEPADKEDLLAILTYFNERKYPWMILGRGSNVLISDEGIRGAVINLEKALTKVFMKNGFVVAEAGVRLTEFVDYCIENGLEGVENLSGIPGSVGGAVVMNAGAYGSEISNHLVKVEIFRDDKLCELPVSECGFGYRSSGFTAKDVILSATFDLPKGDKEKLMTKRREIIQKRNEKQPLNYPNLGSIFKNPTNSYAVKLIEQAGLKGKRVGNAQVSEKHANFIVNLGGAKAQDIVKLIDLVKRTVYQNSGVMLELEIKMVGFSNSNKL